MASTPQGGGQGGAGSGRTFGRGFTSIDPERQSEVDSDSARTATERSADHVSSPPRGRQGAAASGSQRQRQAAARPDEAGAPRRH